MAILRHHNEQRCKNSRTERKKASGRKTKASRYPKSRLNEKKHVAPRKRPSNPKQKHDKNSKIGLFLEIESLQKKI